MVGTWNCELVAPNLVRYRPLNGNFAKRKLKGEQVAIRSDSLDSPTLKCPPPTPNKKYKKESPLSQASAPEKRISKVISTKFFVILNG